MIGQSLYLNRAGSRWTLPGYRVHVYVGSVDLGTRAVDFAEAFGNFAALHYRVKGQRYASIPHGFPGDDGLAVVDISTARRVTT